MTTASIEVHLAAKKLGTALAADALAVPIAVKNSAGNAATIVLTPDGKVPVDAGAVAGGATEAKQDTIITGLASIDGHVDGAEALLTTIAGKDFATQATLAAILAKIASTPAVPFDIAGDILTRPANTTTYASNDRIENDPAADNVIPHAVDIVGAENGAIVNLTQVRLDSIDTGFANATIRLHVFNSDPTANDGVQTTGDPAVTGGDNAAWNQKKAGWVGSLSGSLVSFNDGARGILYPDGPPVLAVPLETGGTRLWWQLQLLGVSPVPSANSTTFQPRFRGYF